jgi:hypothetical protein
MEKTRQAELQKRLALDPTLGEEGSVDPFTVTESPDAKAAMNRSPIPVDPEGKVKMLVFMDEKASVSKEIASTLRPLRERFKGDPNLSVIGLTKRTYSANGLKMQAAQLSFPYPVVSGEALALDLRIQSYPTIIYVAATSKETYRVEGIPSVEEIERVVRVMRGGR